MFIYRDLQIHSHPCDANGFYSDIYIFIIIMLIGLRLQCFALLLHSKIVI